MLAEKTEISLENSDGLALQPVKKVLQVADSQIVAFDLLPSLFGRDRVVCISRKCSRCTRLICGGQRTSWLGRVASVASEEAKNQLLDGVPNEEAMHKCWFRLSDAMNASDGLHLLRAVERRLHEEDVSGLSQVEAVGAKTIGHEQDVYFSVSLELLDVLLKRIGIFGELV